MFEVDVGHGKVKNGWDTIIVFIAEHVTLLHLLLSLLKVDLGKGDAIDTCPLFRQLQLLKKYGKEIVLAASYRRETRNEYCL